MPGLRTPGLGAGARCGSRRSSAIVVTPVAPAGPRPGILRDERGPWGGPGGAGRTDRPLGQSAVIIGWGSFRKWDRVRAGADFLLFFILFDNRK